MDYSNDKYWITREGKAIEISIMGRSHLQSSIDMLARDQLSEFNSRRQHLLELLSEELGTRVAREKLKDLFD